MWSFEGNYNADVALGENVYNTSVIKGFLKEINILKKYTVYSINIQYQAVQMDN